MVIGIKYCGGCNPIYNRARQVELLKKQFPEHRFCDTSQETVCDLWLVVCGCLRACASSDGLTARKRLIRLDSEKSFQAVYRLLADEQSVSEAKGSGCTESGYTGAKSAGINKPKRIFIGQEESFSKCFYKDDVERFAALTGDVSRLHTDPDFAGHTWYKKPIVHGILASSLISAVMGTKLPGEGTIFMEEYLRFLKPVFYGDTITARVRLVSCREGKHQYVGCFTGICENQYGETVAAAKCRQLMMKELFEIINPTDTADSDKFRAIWGSEERMDLNG